MAHDCFIGIDQGSSSTKALVISKEGQVLFQTKQVLSPPLRDEDRVEYDALVILQSVQDVLKEAMQSLQATGFNPRAIGLSCQRSSCLIWNERTREPLSPVISWRDRRGSVFVEQIAAESDYIFNTTGLPLTPYYSASKFQWLKQNSPHADHEAAVFGPLSSFLIQGLTKAERALVDHTHAARTQLMNIQTLDWDPKLLALFGLAGVRLPEIVPTIHNYGAVMTERGPVPFSVSIGDQQSAMVGLGVLEQGDGGVNYGTGGFLMVNTGTKLTTAKGMMTSVHYSTDEARNYLLEGSVNAVGDALEWLRGEMRLFSDYEALDDLCWQAATDVVAFIGLNGTGAPHWEHDISSSIHGMTLQSTAADMIRGTVESIAFFMKDIAEEIKTAGLEPSGFSASGGLSSLSYLVQVQADILGKDIRVSAHQEVSALGAALLAGMAQGIWTTDEIKKLVKSGETIAPRRNPGVEKRYRRWKELHRVTAAMDRIK